MAPGAPPADAAARRGVVERLLLDPPVVHEMSTVPGAALGVWSTEPACYRFLADRCPPGTRTLETGLGLSTALFAALSCEHRCVAPGIDEVERLRTYCVARGIDLDRVTFDRLPSHEALPRITTELDLVLVDGGHGFPTPIIDWFYAGSLLREGGTLVVDDLHLPAVGALTRFLAADARWAAVAGTAKWRAWERRSRGSLAEDWTEQPAYRSEPDARELVVALVRKFGARVKAVVRAAPGGGG